jgi:hypothetical protein
MTRIARGSKGRRAGWIECAWTEEESQFRQAQDGSGGASTGGQGW